MSVWSVILSPDFLFTSIRVMTPILFAALACMVFTKGGIDAIGTEGIMLSCALAGPVGGYLTGSVWGGILLAMAVGVILSCLFGYFTLVEHHAPQKLHIVVAHPQYAARGLAHQGEHRGQQFIETAAVLRLFPVLSQARGKLVVGQGFHFRPQVVAAAQHGAQRFQVALVAGAEYFAHQKIDHGVSP